VHPPLNLLPEGDALDQVTALKTLRLITLAPELPGALDAIPRFVRRHVTVSLGHTDADYDQAIAGLKAGACMFTHLFNAMPPFHHRSPGPVGAAAENRSQVAVTLIPDGVHVHPAALRICQGMRRIFVTDRVPFAGSADAPQTLFSQPGHTAYIDGRAARLADATLAGSLITMLDAARMAWRLEPDSCSIEALTSRNAADTLRLRGRGRIASRARADLILLDRQLNLKAVFVGGREVD
jgi:N-acetylglucosamine-6-phosphate deacetylase